MFDRHPLSCSDATNGHPRRDGRHASSEPSPTHRPHPRPTPPSQPLTTGSTPSTAPVQRVLHCGFVAGGSLPGGRARGVGGGAPDEPPSHGRPEPRTGSREASAASPGVAAHAAPGPQQGERMSDRSDSSWLAGPTFPRSPSSSSLVITPVAASPGLSYLVANRFAYLVTTAVCVLPSPASPDPTSYWSWSSRMAFRSPRRRSLCSSLNVALIADNTAMTTSSALPHVLVAPRSRRSAAAGGRVGPAPS